MSAVIPVRGHGSHPGSVFNAPRVREASAEASAAWGLCIGTGSAPRPLRLDSHLIFGATCCVGKRTTCVSSRAAIHPLERISTRASPSSPLALHCAKAPFPAHGFRRGPGLSASGVPRRPKAVARAKGGSNEAEGCRFVEDASLAPGQGSLPLETLSPDSVPPSSINSSAEDGASSAGNSGHEEGKRLQDMLTSGLEALGSSRVSRRMLLTSASALAAGGMYPFVANGGGIAAALEAGTVAAAALTERATLEGLSSPALASLASRVSTFTLPNGMQWIVLQRDKAPVVSCHTFANVGASDEQDGVTGIAHLLEHLAFKGTPILGTKDYKKEATVLEQLDEVFYALRDAKEAPSPQARRIEVLQKNFDELKQAAAAFSVPNEYGSLISREGGVGLNAVTSQDTTEYYVSLPANKLELWMALESGRFISPVFREIYSEKEVVKEERRLRVDNSPYGRITEDFVAKAFPGRAYGRPTIGFPADLERIGRGEVEEFFARHYTPRSLCCAVVGDVDPEKVESLALKYFGGWATQGEPVGPTPWGPAWREDPGWDSILSGGTGGALLPAGDVPGLFSGGAPKLYEMRVDVNANPLYMEGYLRPNAASTDDPVLSVLSLLLSSTRSSRFYKNLILPSRVLSASASESYPGDKYPSLFLVSAFPNLNGTSRQAARAVRQELQKMAVVGPTSAELARVKKGMQVAFLEALGSNSAMAAALCAFNGRAGSWKGLLEEQQQMADVSKSDVKRVSEKLFQQAPKFALYANRV